MKYLLDTDIASYYLRGRYDLDRVFTEKGIQNITLSRITIGELEVVAIRNPKSKINISSIHLLAQKLGVLEVDADVWHIYSQLKAAMLTAGKPKGDIDMLIASTAKRYGLTVVTNNTAHYVDLTTTENWIPPM